MKIYLSKAIITAVIVFAFQVSYGQIKNPVRHLFPKDALVYENIPYAHDTLKRHLLDLYLPANANPKTPLVVWIHGGAWMLNDKYADMGYMKNTVKSFLENGYALASIDYRYSTDAVFPAQIQDCNQAIEFLYKNAEKYKIDKAKIALVGFSAGGHLASLLGLSNNNTIPGFYHDGKKPSFKISAVIDFYGPSDFFVLLGRNEDMINDPKNPVVILLGASPLQRPDLAKNASPVTYVDKQDPPFLIIQGEKDESVPYTQSVLLSSWLKIYEVRNELIIVPNAPHYGEMFDAESIRAKILLTLNTYLK